MAGAANTQFAVAVHVLSYLGGPGAGRSVSSEELADSTNTNPVYVRRVLGPLRTAGLLRSRPGPGGGWELSRDPASITLAEVWQLVAGDEQVLSIHASNPRCPVGRSMQEELAAVGASLQAAIARELGATTVRDLAERAERSLATSAAYQRIASTPSAAQR